MLRNDSGYSTGNFSNSNGDSAAVKTRRSSTTKGSSSTKKPVPARKRRVAEKKLAKLQKPSIPTEVRNFSKDAGEIITYVLDTNVIMESWDAIFAFNEHEVCIISQVWKELDKQKKGHTDQAWNIRKAIRCIDSLVAGKKSDEIADGINLIPPEEIANGRPHTGKLFFDFSTPTLSGLDDINLSIDDPDDRILMVCLALKKKNKRVVLITKDGSFRIKAKVVGIEVEEYFGESIASVVGEEDVVTGFHHMPLGIWEETAELEVDRKGGVEEYQLSHPFFKNVNRNEFIFFPEQDLSLRVVTKKSHEQVKAVSLKPLSKEDTFGVVPRNREQAYALSLLTNPEVVAVSIAGLAGSGKTYLALAAALGQRNRYRRIIVTRSLIGAEEDIGFLPGTEEEKLAPWMGGFYDNLESLVCNEDFTADEMESTRFMIMNKHCIEIISLNFMRGRNFEDSLIIVDESQNLTPKNLKMVATRPGRGSKIVFLGNVAQIDNPHVTEYTNGFSCFIRAFASSPLSGHITLQKGERSAFATEAEKRL